MQNMNTNNL